jgi:ketosteroid isomerase-like protein
MKHFATVLLIAFLSSLSAAQSNTSANPGADEIRNLEQQWLDAAAGPDLPTLRNMFSNNFMGMAFGRPRVLSKEDVIPPGGASTNHMPTSKLTNSTVRVFGDTAVLMGHVQPQDAQEGAFLVTTVFQKYPQGWQIVAIHMSAAK